MLAESQSQAEERSQEGLPGKKKKRYDAKFKLKVVEFAEKHTNREAGRRFSVGESCVRDWRKTKNKHTELPSKRCRQPSGGRRAQAPDMEVALTAWIEELRGSHVRVTRTSIQIYILSSPVVVMSWTTPSLTWTLNQKKTNV